MEGKGNSCYTPRMPQKHIEAEIRSEIHKDQVPAITAHLRRLGFAHASSTKRTSVMSFGTVLSKVAGRAHGSQRNEVDVRCRTTNGNAEVVAKIGDVEATNRIEIGQPIAVKDLPTFARMFATMGLYTKVGSKRTENYRRKSIVVSIVQSPSGITYLEIEKMSTRDHEKRDLAELNALAKKLQITVIASRKAFLELCDRLTTQDDWTFHGTPTDLKKLRAEIKRARSG